MKPGRFYISLLCFASSLLGELAQAAIVCSPMPDKITQVNRDVRSDIQIGVGTLGKIKAGEIATKTEVIAKNLFDKYPNADRLLTVQMMATTYCSMLAASTVLNDKERQERWETFQDRVFLFINPNYLKPSLPPPSRKEPVKKGETSTHQNATQSSQASTRESKMPSKLASESDSARTEKPSKATDSPVETKLLGRRSSSGENISKAAPDTEAEPDYCVSYHPDDLFIRSSTVLEKSPYTHTLADGTNTLPVQPESIFDAETLLQVARRYKRVCLIEREGFSLSGRNDTIVEWRDASGRIPPIGLGSTPSTVQPYCRTINAGQLSMERDHENGPFFIILSNSIKLLKANSLAGAKAVTTISKKYSRLCIVGSPFGFDTSRSRVVYFE
jgi:hypothetical protein